MLFYIIFDNLEISCFHGDIIVNANNAIIYNGGSHEFLTTTSDLLFNKLSRVLYVRFGNNIFEIEVEITWKMFQTVVSQARYVGVPVCSEKSVNSMFRFARVNNARALLEQETWTRKLF